MSANPVVSIITPVHNAEHYLTECIESIIKQSFHEWELLLINDGSTDRSGEICRSYSLKDSRIKVFHQENHGVSYARNTGISEALGQYVTFIDADDLFLSDAYLSVLLDAIYDHDAEQSICGQLHFHDGTDIPCSQEVFKKVKIITGYDYFNKKVFAPGYGIGTVLGMIFKRTDFINLRFPVGRLAEDNALIHHLLYPSKRIAVIGEKMYGKRIRESSLSSAENCIALYEDTFYAYTDRIVYFIQKNEIALADTARKAMYSILGMNYLRAKELGIENQIPDHLKPRH